MQPWGLVRRGKRRLQGERGNGLLDAVWGNGVCLLAVRENRLNGFQC